ncbi:hypothetical protein V500_10245 [Pseudogymnoascus sp. VKM F-4518 (FW-2643)]|nr:hypothetical protein V500_10245 [Pseudogymnoascus sp. VKM F-4518 (FW-2643)]
MKQRQRPPKRALQQILPAPNPRASFNAKLVIQFVLPKPKDRHQIRPRPQRHLNKPIPPPQHQPQRPRPRIKTLPRPANNNRNSPPHALPIHPPPTKDILAALATHARQPQSEDVLAIKGDAEITIEREEGIRDPGKQLREAQRLGGEGGEGAVADDAVGVVAEDVFPGRTKLDGAMEARGEIAREEGP